MKIQQYKHLYYHHPNGTTFLVYEVLIPLFRPYLSNSLHCLSYIMFECFNFFLPVVPNWNDQTSLCSAKDMSSWYHTYVWIVRGCVNYLFSMTTSFQATILIICSFLRIKTALHSTKFSEFVILSDVPSTTIHPIVPHENWVRLVNFHK